MPAEAEAFGPGPSLQFAHTHTHTHISFHTVYPPPRHTPSLPNSAAQGFATHRVEPLTIHRIQVHVCELQEATMPILGHWARVGQVLIHNGVVKAGYIGTQGRCGSVRGRGTTHDIRLAPLCTLVEFH